IVDHQLRRARRSELALDVLRRDLLLFLLPSLRLLRLCLPSLDGISSTRGPAHLLELLDRSHVLACCCLKEIADYLAPAVRMAVIELLAKMLAKRADIDPERASNRVLGFAAELHLLDGLTLLERRTILRAAALCSRLGAFRFFHRSHASR